MPTTFIIVSQHLLPVGDLDEALQMSEEEFHDRYMAPQPSKRDDNIVFHCRSGIRSEDAMTTAHLLGYTKQVLSTIIISFCCSDAYVYIIICCPSKYGRHYYYNLRFCLHSRARHYIRGFLGWNEFVTSIRGE